MLKNKKVSIVIPVYNVEKYIDQCLVSVVNQTYKNIEIILVDDGSKDSSSQKCDEWAKKDERVKVFHKKNGGLSDARNYGIKKATGEFLLFVDSDDWIDLTMVEKMISVILKDESDMAICQFVMVYQDGTTEKSIDSINKNIIISKKEATKLLLEDNRISNHAWRKLYRKEKFDCNFPVGKNYEDMYITWKLIDNCNRISLLDYPLYFYRQNNSGIISNINIKNLRDFYEGVIVSSNNIETLYPEYKSQIVNYRLKKMIYIYKLLIANKNKIEKKEYKEFRKEIIRDISKIPFLTIEGKKNKLKYLVIKYIHKENFKCNKILKKLKKYKEKIFYIKKYKESSKKTFWIFGTPEYGNLGDHLLLKGEMQFISEYFKDFDIKIIPINDLDKLNTHFINKYVKKEDICAIQAGGNMGTLYPWIHLRQEAILKLMKKTNRNIFVFPQTYFYSNDAYGIKLLNDSKKIYCNSNILVFTRDEKSYKFLQNNFYNSPISLVPDIALILKSKNRNVQRKGMLYCLRTDAESTVSVYERNLIYKTVEKYYDKIDVCDTHAYVPLTPKEADLEINKLFEKFSNSKLVITDRLHGMIIAAITHTPCIILNSKSHKIIGVYNWLKNIPYIRLVENLSDLENIIIELNNIKDLSFNADISNYWMKMYEEIRKISEEI